MAGPHLSPLDGGAISERPGLPGRPLASDTTSRWVRVEYRDGSRKNRARFEWARNPWRRCAPFSRRQVRRCTPMHAWDRRRRELAGHVRLES